MADYRLTRAAAEYLIDIARFGDQHFGIEQSDRLRELLRNRFEEIAEHPLRYSAIDDIRQGYRRSVLGPHSIYFRVLGDGVEIVRVLGRQDVSRSL